MSSLLTLLLLAVYRDAHATDPTNDEPLREFKSLKSEATMLMSYGDYLPSGSTTFGPKFHKQTFGIE